MKEMCTCTTLKTTIALIAAGTGLAFGSDLLAQSKVNPNDINFSTKPAPRQLTQQRQRPADQPKNDGGILGGGCPNPDHDCCTTGTPGCSDEACCDTVCAVDTFCCTVAWDGLCVNEAISMCGLVCFECGNGLCEAPFETFANCPLDCPSPCPNPDHDCFTTGTPGCSDTECCELVCSVDGFCCSVAWDGICVGEAFSLCGFKPGDCPEAVCPVGASDEGEPCKPGITDVINTGCNAVPPIYGSIACGETMCGTFYSTSVLRDTDWFEFTITEPQLVTWTVYSAVPHGAIFVNSACTAAIGVTVPVGTCGQQVSVALAAGTYSAVTFITIFAEIPCTDWVGTLECVDPPPCEPNPGAAVNDCCEDRILIGDGDHAFSTIGANTDGFPNPGCQFDGQTYNDIWYNYEATCSGVLTVSTCNQADYDSDLAVYAGTDCGSLELVACNDDGAGCAGFSSIVSFPVCAGSVYKIRVGGWLAADQGTGILTVSNSGAGCPEPCPSDLNGDGTTNVLDLLDLIEAWGACP